MASTGVDDGHGRSDALPSLTVSVRPSTAAKASSVGGVAGALRRNAYAVTRKALQDLEVAKASAEAKVAELVKENKLLDVQWMAAEARAATAESQAAARPTEEASETRAGPRPRLTRRAQCSPSRRPCAAPTPSTYFREFRQKYGAESWPASGIHHGDL